MVELEQNAVSPDQSFSVKRCLQTLPGDPSDIADTRDYEELESLPDNKRHIFYSYGVKMILIGSISWQWLYTTHMQLSYELIPDTKDASPGPNSYSWIPVEVVVTFGWLLKNYWNIYFLLFKPIEQQKATTMLTQGGHPVASFTVVPGSGHNQQRHHPSESSSQHASQAGTQPTDSFTTIPDSDSADGDGDPQQYLHTLGLNCFVRPCHGICQFRPSSASREPVEWPPSDDAPMHGNAPSTINDITVIHGSLDPYTLQLVTNNLEEKTVISFTLTQTGTVQPPVTPKKVAFGAAHDQKALSDRKGNTRQQTCDTTLIGSQQRLLSEVFKNTKALPDQRRTKHTGPHACNSTVIGEDGQPRTCGKIYKNAHTLTSHKSGYHTGQKTCVETVIDPDGQMRPYGSAFKNARALSHHKSKFHRVTLARDATVVGEDGQQQPFGRVCKNAQAQQHQTRKGQTAQHTGDVTVATECGQPRARGTVYKNTKALRVHRRKKQTGPQTCNATVVGKDGQPRTCGKIYMHAHALSSHKSGYHTGPKTCVEILTGPDGQPRPCGITFKNARALNAHKSKFHIGSRTRDAIVVVKDGQQQPCGSICKDAQAQQSQIRRDHTAPQICDVIMTTEHGQQRTCETVCMNSRSLSSHISRYHTENKKCDLMVVGEDGQHQACSTLCENAEALTNHKRNHPKRKPVDVNQNDDPGSKKLKLNN
ncbi:hypothetical protein [Endozoicomonas sp. ISHI1]|uniref:hypothetical protein n=1 Tax=Endozoicomonas sp. ISHI1 TaxID=2825882 RepID=UPI002147958E|nr:hypothetical protein [Endozoicomonas sp. ISHI1]